MMTERDRQILSEFSARIRQQFPDAQIWAFGSRARGDAQPDSDLDICVVVKTLDRPIWKAISYIAWEISFKYDVLIATIKYSRRQFEESPPCSQSIHPSHPARRSRSMSQPEDIKILVNSRLQQAQDSLAEGQILLQSQFYKGSVNRFYYAMFYATLALLVIRQLGTSKHTGAISLFDREFVKPGIFDKEMSVWLHTTFELRLEADYADLTEISPEEAQECYHRAREFLSRVSKFLSTFEA
jgi:uncharacterized protein (UPF0332 family)